MITVHIFINAAKVVNGCLIIERVEYKQYSLTS